MSVWKPFFTDDNPSCQDIINLLETVESNGYEPRFIQFLRDYTVVYGRSKNWCGLEGYASLSERELAAGTLPV